MAFWSVIIKLSFEPKPKEIWKVERLSLCSWKTEKSDCFSFCTSAFSTAIHWKFKLPSNIQHTANGRWIFSWIRFKFCNFWTWTTIPFSLKSAGSSTMADGWWRMADGGWRMADGGWRMADGGWRMADGNMRMIKCGRQNADNKMMMLKWWWQNQSMEKRGWQNEDEKLKCGWQNAHKKMRTKLRMTICGWWNPYLRCFLLTRPCYRT